VPVLAGAVDNTPLVARLPLQAPLAVHAVAFVADQVSEALAPSSSVAGLTAIVTMGAGGAVTTSEVEALLEPPAPVQFNP
jgi:hypothetical protein